MGSLYVVRHGTILSNKRKVYAGWSEEELDPDGVQDAKKTGEFLSQFEVSKIFTSPLKRTRQTSAILARYLCVSQVIPNENLKEMRLGPWEGMSEDEISSSFPLEFALWNSKPAELRLVGRETVLDVQERALKAVSEIVTENDHKQDCVAVTHVALIRCMFLYFNHMKLNDYKSIDVPNDSIFVIRGLESHGKKEMKRIF